MRIRGVAALLAVMLVMLAVSGCEKGRGDAFFYLSEDARVKMTLQRGEEVLECELVWSGGRAESLSYLGERGAGGIKLERAEDGWILARGSHRTKVEEKEVAGLLLPARLYGAEGCGGMAVQRRKTAEGELLTLQSELLGGMLLMQTDAKGRPVFLTGAGAVLRIVDRAEG